MKILVISESFNNGGLETQIKTMYDNLSTDMEMVFAFGKYTKQIKLESAKIYSDFHFSYISTIKEFCEDVDRLVDIIEKENIDVIHVHPYYSYFPALFASQLTNKKIVYTYHGISSFNFIKSITSSILFYNSIEENCLSNIFAVNEDGVKCFKKLGFNNVSLLQNPIDCTIFKNAQIINNKRWALFSRIDDDKFDEIKMIINSRSDYDIESIDIYGSGALTDELLSYLRDNNLNDIVNYKGYSNNVYETLNGKYNGVIGIGRVLIESLSMGYPSILIGHKKVTGFVNYEMYNELKNKNFVNMKYDKTNHKFPSKQDLLRIQKDIRRKFDVNSVLKSYKCAINNNESRYLKNIKNLFIEIKKLNDNNLLSNCSFYKEREIYKLIKQYIGNYTLSSVVDNIITTTDMMYELFDINFTQVQEMKGMIENEKN